MGWAERAEAGLRSHSRRRPSWPGGRECSVRQLSLRPLGPSAASVPVSGEQVKLRGRLGVCSWSPGASHPLRGGSGRRSFLALRGHWTKATGFLVTALKDRGAGAQSERPGRDTLGALPGTRVSGSALQAPLASAPPPAFSLMYAKILKALVCYIKNYVSCSAFFYLLKLFKQQKHFTC